jgi:hypothetical protein
LFASASDLLLLLLLMILLPQSHSVYTILVLAFRFFLWALNGVAAVALSSFSVWAAAATAAYYASIHTLCQLTCRWLL